MLSKYKEERMITLYNPTDESFVMQHAGISMTLKSGKKMEVEDACGKHLLNSHSTRGLCQLTYGCDEEKIRKDGVERNREFKKRHVVTYNQRNENRKQMGLPYQPPTKEVRQYAIDLGLELLEPFAVRDTEREAISAEKRKNEELQQKVDTLTQQIQDLMSAVGEMTKPPEPAPKLTGMNKRGRPKRK